MNKIFQEILEIPTRANEFWTKSPAYSLPLRVPYFGMGSSYFAPLAFKYMGVEIYPELASEYFTYLRRAPKLPLAVILSQSGRSSEALWCTKAVDQYVAITNNTGSELATRENVTNVISILAGEEHYSSTKTYTNTLLTLFKGFDIDPSTALRVLVDKMEVYQKKGEQIASEVYALLQSETIHGIYITGNGPNLATAMEASLILSESTKRNFHGLPMAQYDHGPKETAKGSIVIQIIAKGPSYQRSLKLSETIRRAGGHVIHVEEPDVEENLSILNNIVPFNFMAFYLAQHLNVGETFTVGGKVTEVE